MDETMTGTVTVRAVDLVRRIRDDFYERTRDLAPEALAALIAREAAASRAEAATPAPGEPHAPAA